jgi:SprB repeat
MARIIGIIACWLGITFGAVSQPYIYISGSSTACPGTNNSYQVFLVNPSQFCFYKTFTATWSVTGGVFKSVSTNTSFVQVEWTSNGPKSITASIFEPFISLPCPNNVSATLSSITMSVPIGAPTPIDPGSITPTNGSLCPVTPLTPTTLQTTTLEINTPTIIPATELVWEYKLNGGSFQSLAITAPTAPKSSTVFTVPNTAQPNDSYVFSVYSRYIVCPNIRSTNTGFSFPVTVLPAAPTFDFDKADVVCTTLGSITIKNIMFSSSRVLVRLRNLSNGLNVGSDMDYPNTAQPSYTGLSAGNYQVQMQNYPVGCFVESKPITIGSSNPVVGVSIAGFTNETCYDPVVGTGSIDITPSSGSGSSSYTYAWDNGAGISQDAINLKGNIPYSVTVTDGNGCTGMASQLISEPSEILLGTPLPINVSCKSGLLSSNGQISFSTAPTGGTPVSPGVYDYDWRNSSNTQVGTGATLTGVPADNYTVKVTDANGCAKATSPAIPISKPLLDVSPGTASGTDPLCNGLAGSIKLTGASGGTGALSYTVSPTIPGGTQSVGMPIANVPAMAGGTLYSITVKDANGCTAVANSVTLTAPAAVTATNATVQPTCFGGANGNITVTSTNGVGALQYSKDGGTTYQTGNIFTGLSAGSYSIKAKDSNGCTNPVSSTAIVGQPSAVSGTIASPSPFTCFSTGNSATLNLTPSGGTASYTFFWSTGATTEDITVTLASSLSTNYSVAITDSKGCTTNSNITLTQPAQLTGAIVPTNVTCFGLNTGKADLNPTGGTAPYAFSWSNGASSEDLISRPAGSYSVTITDSNSCTATASTTITEPALFTLVKGGTANVLCNGQLNGTVVLVAGGGIEPYEYSRDAISWQSNPSITGLGSATYTLHARDKNLCSKQVSVTITQPALLTVSLGSIQGAACGQSNGSAQSSAAGGTGTYSFVWKNSLNQTVSTTPALANVPGGIYRVTVTDQNGCTDFKDAAIASPNGPQVAISSVTGTNCWDSNDGRANITITGGQTPYKVPRPEKS